MKKKGPEKRVNLDLVRRYPISSRRNLVKAGDFASGIFASAPAGEPGRSGTPARSRVSPNSGAQNFFPDLAQSFPDILKGREFKELIGDLLNLRHAGLPVVLGMGGHVVKCGLSPVVIALMEAGAITGVALNGSTAIHDFEVAMIGETSEDVAETLGEGSFGMAEETGRLFNEAVSGAVRTHGFESNPPGIDPMTPAAGPGMGAALAATMEGAQFPHRRLSILWNAFRLGLPATVHVAMGTDIVHMHPEFDPAATGIATHRDFLELSAQVADMLSGGGFINFGSAVVLPEVFLKALTVARNLRAQTVAARGFGGPGPCRQGPSASGTEPQSPGGAAFDSELPFVTANFDMIQHYRPTANVVKRPANAVGGSSGGRGYAFTGHHEIMLPLLAGCLISGINPVKTCLTGGFVPGEEAGEFFGRLRKTGVSRLVFTNGCFDILHPGHARYLAAARQLGDALVVAINSDASVRRLKGPTRPINSEAARAEMLLALSSVDFVTVFTEDTPFRIIEEVRPEVLVKGGDWTQGSIVGEDLVRSWGGEVLSLPLEEGYSSTKVILAAGLGEASPDKQSAGPGPGGVTGRTDGLDVLGVIPARFASTRLPGKPLANIAGKTMVERVHARAAMAGTLSRVVVATDDERIVRAVEAFGGKAVLTRPDHPSGSDRIAEVARKWGGDIVVNIQGDEPLIDPADIDLAVRTLAGDPDAMVSTLATPFREGEDPDDPSKVKVVVDSSGRALYFSRAPIPHFRDGRPSPGSEPKGGARFLKHVGLYAFRRQALDAFTRLEPSSLEIGERLEQLRLLENGYSIKVALTDNSPLGVDTPEDLERVSKVILGSAREGKGIE